MLDGSRSSTIRAYQESADADLAPASPSAEQRLRAGRRAADSYVDIARASPRPPRSASRPACAGSPARGPPWSVARIRSPKRLEPTTSRLDKAALVGCTKPLEAVAADYPMDRPRGPARRPASS